MSQADIILAFGLGAGVLLGGLVTTALAILLWEKTSARVEGQALRHGFMLGRKNERAEIEKELRALDWQADVRTPCERPTDQPQGFR